MEVMERNKWILIAQEVGKKSKRRISQLLVLVKKVDIVEVKYVPMWTSLFQEHEGEGVVSEEDVQLQGIRLLQSMELVELENEEEAEEIEAMLEENEDSMSMLPQDLCSKLRLLREELDGPESQVEKDVLEELGLLREWGFSTSKSDTQEKAAARVETKPAEDDLVGVHKKKVDKSKAWGPILVERRTTKRQEDGRSIMEKAQMLKKKSNLEEPKELQLDQHGFNLGEDDTHVEELAGPMSHSLTGCIQSSCFQVGGALKEGGTPNGLIWSNWMGVDRFQAGGGSMDVSKTEAEA